MRIARAVAFSALVLALGVMTWSATGQVSSPSFLFMDELEAGMEGIGKTTVRGNEMATFNVKVVGTVDNPGDTNDYIMVRSHGEAIEMAGGYAQGMSGSPIYVNDKLIGAFYGAFAFNDSANPIGFVRPIETMLPIAESVAQQAADGDKQQGMFDPQTPVHPALASALSKALPNDIDKVQYASTPPSLTERRAHPETAYAVPMSTSLWVGGLSGRALASLKSGVPSEILRTSAPGLMDLGGPLTDRLRDTLTKGVQERFDKRVLPMASAQEGSGSKKEFAELEAGRPMSAQLAQGDVSFGSVCTTSYVDPASNVLLACGHQIFMTGKSSMFLSKARVVDTVKSAQISFVLPQVSRNAVHGTIRQDRAQAIGASLGDGPRSIDLNAQVVDRATGNERKFKVRMADSGNLLGSLVYSSLLQAVDSTINRIGQGTMSISYSIDGENLPQPLQRNDVFASQSDVAVQGPLQVAQAVLLLKQNEFKDPKITNVDVKIEVKKPLQQFRVMAISTDKDTYQPGETVQYSAKLRAFRGEEQTVEGKIELPDYVQPRQVTIRVAGGARQQQQSNSSGSKKPEFSDLEGLIKAVESSETNDQLTVELLGLPSSASNGDADERQTASVSFGDVKRLGTGIVTGVERTSLKISRASDDGDRGESEEGETSDDSTEDADNDDEDSSDDEADDGCSSNYYC